MNEYILKERHMPCDDTWDVIVVGGGPAGCAAATAAAREGARTLLIEATGCLGGMGTAGLVPAWCPFSDKEKIVYRGLAEKVFEACKDGMMHVDSNATDWVGIDPELLKRIYDDMLTEVGVTVLFNTFLSAVEMDDDNSVSVVIVSNKNGLTAYKAGIYIDCSGDADLAAWAGAEFLKGDEKTGEIQAATHCFMLSNVDIYGYLYGPELYSGNTQSPIYDILDSGKYQEIIDVHICNNLVGPGTVGFNAGHILNVDNTDPSSVSYALMKGRKIAAQIKEALSDYFPQAFGNAFLSSTATLMGIRETRRIIGDYLLTIDDYCERRSFDDEICRNSYFVDMHSSEMINSRVRGKYEDNAERREYGKGESHGIPYRCLTPKGLNNVLVAGRSVSCDRMVQGSVRVMPVCLAMGEAAGIAAAMAATSIGGNVHKVDTEMLRARLKEHGAYLP